MQPSGQEDKGQGSGCWACGPPSLPTAVWAKLVSGPSQRKGAQARGQVAKDVPCPTSPTHGLPFPMSFLIARVGWKQLTAPLARRVSQLLEAAA